MPKTTEAKTADDRKNKRDKQFFLTKRHLCNISKTTKVPKYQTNNQQQNLSKCKGKRIKPNTKQSITSLKFSNLKAKAYG